MRRQRNVAPAPVDPHFQRIAYRPIMGFPGRKRIAQVDFAPLAGSHRTRIIGCEQPARNPGPKLQPHRTAGSIRIADSHLLLPALIYIGKGAERSVQPEPGACLERILFPDRLLPRHDRTGDRQRRDFLPLRRIDAQRFGKDARPVHRVVSDRHTGRIAGQHGPARKLRDGTPARSHHVEHHHGLRAPVDARKGMAHPPAALLDSAEVPRGRREHQLGAGLTRAAQRHENEQYSRYRIHRHRSVLPCKGTFFAKISHNNFAGMKFCYIFALRNDDTERRSEA